MRTVSELQTKMRNFNSTARSASSAADLQKAWNKMFGVQLSSESANAFLNHYRGMRSKSRKMRGGSYSPAQLSYTMTPGMTVETYGRFPVDISTDPESIKSLDVYFNDSLAAGCGKEAGMWPSPAPTMGSNKVGGGRRRHSLRRGRRGIPKSLKKHRRGKNYTLRRHRGGNLLDSIGMRPYIATNPENALEGAVRGVYGQPTAPSGDPVQHTWQMYTNPSNPLFNPSIVTSIGSDISRLASPAPWQTSA